MLAIWMGFLISPMEFIEGGSLAQKLNGVPQPAREAASMMVFAGSRGARSASGRCGSSRLKPSNILLTSMAR